MSTSISVKGPAKGRATALCRVALLCAALLPAGCSSDLLRNGSVMPHGEYRRTIHADGYRRGILIHVPPQYDGKSPLPLVVALHGGYSNAGDFRDKSGLSGKADSEGFIVVYPEGVGVFKLRGWNAVHCCMPWYAPEPDDSRFIGTLIEALKERLKIDPRRVYVTGTSNGGMLAHLVAAEYSESIAAIAPVAATIGGRGGKDGPIRRIPAPSSPVSVIAINGMRDERVAYFGGRSARTRGGREDISAEESVNFWAGHNSCAVKPTMEEDEGGGVILYTYHGCDGGTEVVLRAIRDGGHDWPENAKDIIWDFFKDKVKQ